VVVEELSCSVRMLSSGTSDGLKSNVYVYLVKIHSKTIEIESLGFEYEYKILHFLVTNAINRSMPYFTVITACLLVMTTEKYGETAKYTGKNAQVVTSLQHL
jgi:hypothetical protein